MASLPYRFPFRKLLLPQLLGSTLLTISCAQVYDDQQQDLHDMVELEYLKKNFLVTSMKMYRLFKDCEKISVFFKKSSTFRVKKSHVWLFVCKMKSISRNFLKLSILISRESITNHNLPLVISSPAKSSASLIENV